MRIDARTRLAGFGRSGLARLAHVLRGGSRDTLDALLPQRCAGCGAALGGARPGGGVLCTACEAAIPRLSLGLCSRCLAAARDPVGCGGRHPAFAVWPAWVYDRRAEAVVHALKFGGRPALAAGLGGVLARAAAHLVNADAVTAVPLHRARRRERGYNQAGLLAAALARELALPHVEDVVERTRATRAQARLGARERRDNLTGAFRVARPEWVRGRRVVVVDDVITTGATLEACLGALEEAGARPVAVTLAWAQ